MGKISSCRRGIDIYRLPVPKASSKLIAEQCAVHRTGRQREARHTQPSYFKSIIYSRMASRCYWSCAGMKNRRLSWELRLTWKEKKYGTWKADLIQKTDYFDYEKNVVSSEGLTRSCDSGGMNCTVTLANLSMLLMSLQAIKLQKLLLNFAGFLLPISRQRNEEPWELIHCAVNMNLFEGAKLPVPALDLEIWLVRSNCYAKYSSLTEIDEEAVGKERTK